MKDNKSLQNTTHSSFEQEPVQLWEYAKFRNILAFSIFIG